MLLLLGIPPKLIAMVRICVAPRLNVKVKAPPAANSKLCQKQLAAPGRFLHGAATFVTPGQPLEILESFFCNALQHFGTMVRCSPHRTPEVPS